MFKGKLGIVPEIAATTAMVVIGLIVLRGAYDTDFADTLAKIPFVGPVLVTGPKAAIDRAVAG
jgi:xanthine/uracil/vitamin C permease (AzgA family)